MGPVQYANLFGMDKVVERPVSMLYTSKTLPCARTALFMEVKPTMILNFPLMTFQMVPADHFSHSQCDFSPLHLKHCQTIELAHK